jgi:hypothetical protein
MNNEKNMNVFWCHPERGRSGNPNTPETREVAVFHFTPEVVSAVFVEIFTVKLIKL